MRQVVILAGGEAKRLRPVTESVPKALVKIEGKPFVDWQLELLAKNKFSRVIFCTSYKSDMIQNYVGNGSKYGLEISFVEDGKERLGTGGAIRNAIPHLDQEFIVMYGDSFLDINFQQVSHGFDHCSKPAMMTIYKNDGKYDNSNVKLNNRGDIFYNKENPDASFKYIDYGLIFFKREVFEETVIGKTFDLSEMLHKLSKQFRIAGFEVQSRFYEVGSFSGIIELETYLRKKNNVVQ
jgi:NDP-sugar pyrophosphorylase family protein